MRELLQLGTKKIFCTHVFEGDKCPGPFNYFELWPSSPFSPHEKLGRSLVIAMGACPGLSCLPNMASGNSACIFNPTVFLDYLCWPGLQRSHLR